MENMILIDWFSMTSKIHSPENFISMLGLQDVSCYFGNGWIMKTK